MKRFDDSTKKLIKNVAALVTSALVLIAATIAWFTNSNRAQIGAVTSNTQSNVYSVHYSKLQTVDNILYSVTTGSGSSAAFTLWSSTGDPLQAQPTYTSRASSGWTETDESQTAGTWSIASLYPGEYDGFRMDVQHITPKLVIGGITCKDLAGNVITDTSTLNTIYQNVYLYAEAMKVTTETVIDQQTHEESILTTYSMLQNTSESGGGNSIVCDSLYNLLDKGENWSVVGTQTLKALTALDGTGIGDDATAILFYIGIPGDNANGNRATTSTAHDALRQIGAQICFTSVLPADS